MDSAGCQQQKCQQQDCEYFNMARFSSNDLDRETACVIRGTVIRPSGTSIIRLSSGVLFGKHRFYRNYDQNNCEQFLSFRLVSKHYAWSRVLR